MDVVDAFVVSLGLDPSQYNREIKNYRDDRKRLAQEDAKYNQSSEDAQKRSIQGIRTLRNETAGFLVALAGANSVKDFAANLITGDAATGRLAKNLGLATEQVGAWEGAIKRVGGSAESIQGALRSMSSAFQSLQLTGTSGHDADFQGLGVTAKDLQNPQEALLKISEASGRMGRPEFNARLSRLGFDADTINLLAKGRGELTRLLEEQRKLGVATDKSAAEAQKFQDEWSKLSAALTGEARPAIFGVVHALNEILEKGDAAGVTIPVLTGVVGALGIAFAVAYAPALLLAGAIAAVVAAAMHWDEVKGLFDVKSGAAPPVEGLGGESVGGFWGALGVKGAAPKSSAGGSGGIPFGGALDGLLGGVGARTNLAGASGATGSGNRSAAAVEQFFRARGYTAAQARGITAAVVAEGGLGQRTGGGYQGRALGIGQLLGDRRAAFLKKYGQNFTFQQELEFMHHELQGGDPGGAAVRGSTSERGALQAMVTKFYRPGRGAETIGDLNRGAAWLGGGAGATVPLARAGGGSTTSTTQTTTVGQVVVYSAATDADGIAHDMRGALAKRGLVAQANTGLQP